VKNFPNKYSKDIFQKRSAKLWPG